MPRLGNGQEVLEILSSLTRFIPATSTPVDVFTNAAIAALAATASFAATPTGIVGGDPLSIVGDGGYELNAASATPSSGSLALKYKAAFAQSSGAEVIRLQSAALGHLGAGGLSFGGNLPRNPVQASTQKPPICYTTGSGELTANTTLLGFNLENVALFFGMDDTAVTGAGTSGDPYQLAIGGTSLGSHGLFYLRAQGTKKNGKNMMVDFCGVNIEVNGQVTWGGNSSVAELALSWKYLNAVLREW